MEETNLTSFKNKPEYIKYMELAKEVHESDKLLQEIPQAKAYVDAKEACGNSWKALTETPEYEKHENLVSAKNKAYEVYLAYLGICLANEYNGE